MLFNEEAKTKKKSLHLFTDVQVAGVYHLALFKLSISTYCVYLVYFFNEGNSCFKDMIQNVM